MGEPKPTLRLSQPPHNPTHREDRRQTVQAFNVGSKLAQLIAQGHISKEALTAITGIQSSALTTLVAADPGLSANTTGPSPDEVARASALTVQLTQGTAIGDNERLQSIIEALSSQYQLSYENIALLTQTPLEDLQAFLADPAATPSVLKFHLAVRAYNLLHSILNAAPSRR